MVVLYIIVEQFKGLLVCVYPLFYLLSNILLFCFLLLFGFRLLLRLFQILLRWQFCFFRFFYWRLLLLFLERKGIADKAPWLLFRFVFLGAILGGFLLFWLILRLLRLILFRRFLHRWGNRLFQLRRGQRLLLLAVVVFLIFGSFLWCRLVAFLVHLGIPAWHLMLLHHILGRLVFVYFADRLVFVLIRCFSFRIVEFLYLFIWLGFFPCRIKVHFLVFRFVLTFNCRVSW